MKIKILNLQKISFGLVLVFSVLIFIAAIIFSTSYCETYLYGNSELVEYYTNDLQVVNKQYFIYALIIVVSMVIVVLINPKKYYPSFVTYPILILISVCHIILGFLIIGDISKINNYYLSYDYSVISKLTTYSPNQFYMNFSLVSILGLIVSNGISCVIYSLGFYKFIVGRSHNDEKNG